MLFSVYFRRHEIGQHAWRQNALFTPHLPCIKRLSPTSRQLKCVPTSLALATLSRIKYRYRFRKPFFYCRFTERDLLETSGLSFGFLTAPTWVCVGRRRYVQYKIREPGRHEHGKRKKERNVLFCFVFFDEWHPVVSYRCQFGENTVQNNYTFTVKLYFVYDVLHVSAWKGHREALHKFNNIKRR